MLTFATAVFFLIVTPGPGVLSAAAVGAGFGFRAGVRYVAGLFIGSNLVSLAVVSGLAATVLAYPAIRTVLFTISLGYLVYLAMRIAFAGARVGFAARARRPGLRDGILLQVVNPKAYLVSTALFGGFAFLPSSYAAEVVTKFVIVNAIWLPVHFFWLWLGVALHELDLSERSHRLVNAAMACALLGVVALAIVSAV
jgi:threonine/homoserine/homoserine lactone efflux protein